MDALADHICAPDPQPSRSPPAAARNSPVSSRRLAPPSQSPPGAYAGPRSPSPLRTATSPAPRPSFDSQMTRPSFDHQRPQPPRSPFQDPMAQMARGPSPQPLQQPLITVPPPDTKIGGEAGMAGVGRRAFAAVAAAAVFTVAHPTPHRHPKQYPDLHAPILNIPDPVSPPPDRRSPSPYMSNHGHSSNHGHGSNDGHASPYQNGKVSPVRESPTHDQPASKTHATRFAASQAKRPQQPSLDMSSSTTSPKLAYLESVRSPTSSGSPVTTKRRNTDDDNNYPKELSALTDDRALDTKSNGDSRHERGIDFPRRGRQDADTDSMYSTSSREHHKSGVSLERSLSSPYESMSSPALSQSTHPTSAGSSAAPEHLRAPPVPHPTRSNTSPSLSRTDKAMDQPTTRRRTEKQCVKCGKKITDGKWIQVDSTGGEKPTVLCEYDWKMLYLPKCRRCDKPIEGQAIGSSDGQIKGKYHRDCFNCETCQKPFPDKSFYVFDGKPFCEYHYHEENNSLCASPRCGMPIEGPCAVAHNGDRYHPAHFVCESPSCKERLDDEYWEIDGTRLCDKHARSHPMFEEMKAPSESDRRENGEVRDSLASISSYDAGHASMARAQKRMTRYVDL